MHNRNALTELHEQPELTPQAVEETLRLEPSVPRMWRIASEDVEISGQQIEAGQEVHMPLSFMLNPKLPKDVKVVTLSYTFFDITNTAALNKDNKDRTVFAFN